MSEPESIDADGTIAYHVKRNFDGDVICVVEERTLCTGVAMCVGGIMFPVRPHTEFRNITEELVARGSS